MQPSHPQIYESIGSNYSQLRIPDQRIADQIFRALGDAKTICNVGAGAGSYEPTDREVTAVEPSATMIAQRTSLNQVVQASAEKLPFDDYQFDAAMASLTVHHWIDAVAGLKEMKRVSHRQVVFAFAPEQLDSLWLIRDYLPDVITLEKNRSMSVDQIANVLHATTVEPVMIPHDCTDGFQAAYWRRPSAYLDHHVRAAISSMSQLPQELVTKAMTQLQKDLNSGSWEKRYGNLLQLTELDLGYRLVIAA